MRYNLESTLPLGAFKPRGGLFAKGMTLHGGGGGFIEDVGNAIGDAVSGVGDAVSGVWEGAQDIGQSVVDAVSDAGVAVDNAVGDYVPGGWGTVAAVAVPFIAPYAAPAMMGALTAELGAAGAAAAVSAGTSAATSAIKGKSLEETLKDAAISGATSYGLASLGGGAPTSESGTIDKFGNTVEIGAPIPEPKVDTASLTDTLKEVVNDTPINVVSQDNPYTDQIIKAFENPDLNLNAPSPYASTAATVSSDIPAPDLVPKGVAPDSVAYENLIQNLSSANPPVTSDPYENLIQTVAGNGDFAKEALPAGTREYEKAIQALANTPIDSPAFQPAAEPSVFDKIANAPKNAYNYLTETPISEIGSDFVDSVMDNPLAWGAGALGVAGLAGQGPLAGLGQKLGTAKMLGGSSPSSGGGSSAKPTTTQAKDYKYGSAGELDPNYLLRNRINAGNVYGPATGYRPITTRYADGGEVKHFGLGGIADAFTSVFQPVEKAVIRPIADAVPFVKDLAPYAGMIAAPFIASPMAAAGVGALASGMGQGGFNMKRALMGGISAYGMSNLGAGLEAAGSLTPMSETEGVSKAIESNNFFRSPEAMTKGLENLVAGGDSYKLAASNFATKAGLPSAAMTIMGQSGVSAIDEGIKQQAEADKALAESTAAQNERDAKTQAARERAFAAIHSHPYQYAVGGSVDDESGMDEARGLYQGNLYNGFMGGGMPSYAAGGVLDLYAEGGTPRFLSGGGDGMSDSIPATIDGTQEARLADGEFVIPADVVSHLGNGSSKAGAKQLYSMMDRVRKARTGNKKQGKQINPRKLMAA